MGLTRDPISRKQTFANGATVGTEAINIERASFGGVFADASFDGGEITWEVAFTSGRFPDADVEADSTNLTWYDAVDGAGSAIPPTQISAGEYAAIPAELFGARFLRGTSDTVQTGAGFVTLVLKG